VSDKPVIFISYSHRDRPWLDYVRSFFEPFADHWNLQIWDDEKLRIGDDWKGDIYSAIDTAGVFVLLVSRYALSSTFILNDEADRAWSRPRSDVQFCPLVVTPYHAPSRPWLEQPNRRPRDGKALSELSDPERDREMATIAKQVHEIVESFVKKVSTSATPAQVPPRIERRSFPSIVDYGRLPETPYKTLVGREVELKQLDDAWADQKTRVISLIAWGGAGKTSLVIEWLTRVRNDAYRGADAVLCWSFYSQGTQERAAAGEGLLDWALGKLKVRIDTPSATAKGERLAEELLRRRVLLVLDGLEPLQFGSEEQEGALKEHGLRVFLRALAMKQPQAGHSLVVITSRLALRDLTKWEGSTAPKIDLWRLSDEAGAALLAEAGVTGTPDELRAAAHEFAGHALALSLLAAFLKLLHHGQVGARIRIRPMVDDTSGHDQARRVVEALENEWLTHEPTLHAIMYMVGLFDRPVQWSWIEALRARPVIEGITNSVADLDEGAWRTAITRLREARLLDREDSLSPDALDAHPLVREWFGERLNTTSKTAWRAAHGRLYEHLRDVTKEGNAPTLEDLTPLFQAIMHGCRAGRQQETLDDIYKNRICRRRSSGHLEFYSTHRLGALNSELAAISWFFDEPYAAPATSLDDESRAWLLGQAAYFLQAQVRLPEALSAMRTSLLMDERNHFWLRASTNASNLSETELLIGEIQAAVIAAKKSVEHADRSKDQERMMGNRTILAEALECAGQRRDAERLFRDAERRQKKRQSTYPILYSRWGYRYCDLLLAKGTYIAARDRAIQILRWESESDTLLDRARVRLALGRALLHQVLKKSALLHLPAETRNESEAAGQRLNEAVEGLRTASHLSDNPSGFFARAAFRRSIGDWSGVARDLDEAFEIAEPGPMRLYLCDTALERTRLAFAQIEAFAPLNGMLEKGQNPPKPEVPSLERIMELKAEAEKQIKIADDYIQSCGYHRRDEELAELKDVFAGKRTFASLPPRV